MSNEKYVKLMADYCSDGVWNSDGASISIDSLSIPFWLKSMILDWQAVYDVQSFENENFDIDSFSKDGYALAVKLKQNLPDFTVEYFDEAECEKSIKETQDNVKRNRQTFIKVI